MSNEQSMWQRELQRRISVLQSVQRECDRTIAAAQRRKKNFARQEQQTRKLLDEE